MEDAIAVEMLVNGRTMRAAVPGRRLLVHLLRDEFGLTGTHVGCDTSQCGACAVVIDGEAVKSCTILAAQASGSVVRTIEDLAPAGRLDAVQRAFVAKHALQCGFCTPGMVIAAHELLRRTPRPTDDQIREGLHGNLCRCTGYHNIVAAVRHAAAVLAGDVAELESAS